MCIGIPMQVVEPGAETALCEGRGARERINCLLVGAQPPGTWVLTFQGTALRVRWLSPRGCLTLFGSA